MKFTNMNTEIKSEWEISSGKYSVRLAENREEIESALRLRFYVFNVELGEGLQESYDTKMDEDVYDQYCDHLIVLENKTNQVIGTYRVQDNEIAEEGEGFYTANEFKIDVLPDSILSDAFELGRACIDKDHRNGRVLFLLWRGLAKYMMLLNKRYLFGCCSITSQNPAEGLSYYAHLKEEGYLHKDYLIDVEEEYVCEVSSKTSFSGEVKIPQLFQLYLDVGCKVCSPPALDKEFKTIDFLILLDLETLSEQTRALFLK
ncbi:MAG: GNAT family N-acyltransferase [Balneola sp.]